MMRLLLVAGLVLLLGPASSPAAAELELRLDGPRGLLDPGRPSPAGAAITLDCETALRIAPDQASLAALLQWTVGDRSVKVDGPTEVQLEKAACLQPGATNTTAHATFNLTAGPGTMPEVKVPLTLDARVEASMPPSLESPQYARAQGEAIVRLVPAFTAQAPQAEKRGGPQTSITFPIDVRNLGNGRVQVDAMLVGDATDGWRPIPPVPFVLDAAGQGSRSSLTVQFVVATPYHDGYVAGDADFTLRLTARSVRDPANASPPVDLTFHASADGWYIPGPGGATAFALVGTLLLGAAALRRARTG